MQDNIFEEIEKVAEIIDEKVMEPAIETVEDIAKKTAEEVEFIDEKTEKIGEKAIETMTNK